MKTQEIIDRVITGTPAEHANLIDLPPASLVATIVFLVRDNMSLNSSYSRTLREMARLEEQKNIEIAKLINEREGNQ